MAFYESLGIDGWKAFEKTVKYIKENYSDQFIIADAKRGDIGNTSELYARSFFEHLDIDSVTVAPYMGEDSVKPFLLYPNKWVIVLGLTSKVLMIFSLQQIPMENVCLKKCFGYRKNGLPKIR